jgi:hypothetical protein
VVALEFLLEEREVCKDDIKELVGLGHPPKPQPCSSTLEEKREGGPASPEPTWGWPPIPVRAYPGAQRARDRVLSAQLQQASSTACGLLLASLWTGGRGVPEWEMVGGLQCTHEETPACELVAHDSSSMEDLPIKKALGSTPVTTTKNRNNCVHRKGDPGTLVLVGTMQWAVSAWWDGFPWHGSSRLFLSVELGVHCDIYPGSHSPS